MKLSSAYLKFKRARWMAIGWTLLIFILCLMPGKEFPDVDVPLADKWVHFVLFGIFSFLWLRSFAVPAFHRQIVIFFAAALVGWLVEELQGLLSFLGRSKDELDILADAIGGLLGVLIFIVFHRLRKK